MGPHRSPNADTIGYWNDDAGPRWVRQAKAIDRQLEPFLRPLSRVSGAASRERILDVGCGAGALCFHLAPRVAPGGSIRGVDVSEVLLAFARRRAAEREVAGVEFHRADAQVEAFDRGRFDRVVSRFGVMFFDDSIEAFSNLRRALRPGGTLSFVCWRAPEDNPWMGIPREVVARHAELPAPPDPRAPGPFRFSDAGYVQELLHGSGFEAVTIDRLDGKLTLGGRASREDAVSFLMEVGPAAALRDADPGTLRSVREELSEALAPHSGPDGVVMRYGAWLVHARNGRVGSESA